MFFFAPAARTAVRVGPAGPALVAGEALAAVGGVDALIERNLARGGGGLQRDVQRGQRQLWRGRGLLRSRLFRILEGGRDRRWPPHAQLRGLRQVWSWQSPREAPRIRYQCREPIAYNFKVLSRARLGRRPALARLSNLAPPFTRPDCGFRGLLLLRHEDLVTSDLILHTLRYFINRGLTRSLTHSLTHSSVTPPSFTIAGSRPSLPPDRSVSQSVSQSVSLQFLSTSFRLTATFSPEALPASQPTSQQSLQQIKVNLSL